MGDSLVLPFAAGALAVVLFVVTLVAGILAVVARAQKKALAALEAQGVERRSGPRTIRVKLDAYRSPRVLHSSMRARRRGELVLTREACVLVSSPYVIALGGERMPDLEVGVEGAALRLVTDRPHDASGGVDVTIPVDDVEGWKAALAARGARV